MLINSVEDYRERFNYDARNNATLATALSVQRQMGLSDVDTLKMCIVHLIEQNNAHVERDLVQLMNASRNPFFSLPKDLVDGESNFTGKK